MDYPLMIDGNDAGTLSVSEEGLYTCFEAHAGEHDGLVRLWVCGGGECAYLGVMQPWSGGLYLRRRLSRRELKDFPAQIEYAADQSDDSLHNLKSSAAKPHIESASPATSLHNICVDSPTPSCPFPADIPAMVLPARRDSRLLRRYKLPCCAAGRAAPCRPARRHTRDRRTEIHGIPLLSISRFCYIIQNYLEITRRYITC